MAYDAFISYSHAFDQPVAAALQSGLQRLGKPWYKMQQLSVFRDEADLSAAPQLWKRITEGLSAADYFILLASPEAISSSWVKKEIAFWIANKNPDHIIIALTSGTIRWHNERNDFDEELSTAIPKELIGRFSMEPLYIDLSSARSSEDLSLNNPTFKTNIAGISATIQNISPKALIDRDVLEHRKTVKMRNAVIAALSLLLVGLTLNMGFWKDYGYNYQGIVDIPLENLLILINAMNRNDIIEWLKWNDPNGVYDDRQSLKEFGNTMSLEEGIEILLRQVNDNRVAVS